MLHDKNIKYKSYKKINESLNEYDLIINTTPIGTYPNISEKPKLNYSLLSEKHFCYDLIYNPKKSSFLIECEKKELKQLTDWKCFNHKQRKVGKFGIV